jgi:uncharacterized protein YfaQ (DUF2300 family)
MSIINLIKLFFAWFFIFSIPSYAAIEDQDWQRYLSKSCSPTITGGAKKLMGERSFWAHVDVSMDSWAQSMKIEKPQDDCYIHYRDSSQSTKLLQCIAGYRELWDWYARCKPIVVNACRTAGGFCN